MKNDVKAKKANIYILKKNLKSIKKYKPQIDILLKDAVVDENIIIEKVIDNNPYFSYQLDKDNKVQITSMISPDKLAKEIVEYEFKEREDTLKQSTTALAFVTDPYICKALIDKYCWFRQFFMIFPSADYFYALLHYLDFSDLIKNPAFMPIMSNDIDSLIPNVEHNLSTSGLMYSGLKLFSYTPFEKIAQEFHEIIRERLVKLTTLMQTNLATDIRLGDKMYVNELRSLDKFIEYPDVRVLKDRLNDKPVVCVAAGPSLSKNMDYLKEIQDEVFIIAAASCLKPLLKKGIKPDIVTILDMQEAVIKYLQDVDVEDLTIAIEMSCYYGVMEEIKANYIILPDSLSVRGILPMLMVGLQLKISHDMIVGGGFSVAFMSIFLAKYLGASQIILLGQDLAYGEKSHIEGASYSKNLEIIKHNGVRCFKQQMHDKNEYMLYPIIEVDGYYDETVLTIPVFDVFRIFLEKQIADKKLDNVVNSTEGGAFIKGAEHLSLKDAYEKYIVNNEIDKSKLEPIVYEFDKSKLPACIKSITDVLDYFTETKEIVDKALDSFITYKELYDKESEGEKLEYSEEVDIRKAMEIVNNAMEDLYQNHASILRYVADVSRGAHYSFKLMESINTSELVDDALEADKRNKVALFLSSINEGLDFYVRELTNLIDKIKEKYSEYFENERDDD